MGNLRKTKLKLTVSNQFTDNLRMASLRLTTSNNFTDKLKLSIKEPSLLKLNLILVNKLPP
jgi:hypothetical protein